MGLFFLQCLGRFLSVLLRCQLFVAGDDKVNSLALFQHSNCHIKQLLSVLEMLSEELLRESISEMGKRFSLREVLELSREMFHSVRRGHC